MEQVSGGNQSMNEHHAVKNVHFKEECLFITVDGKKYTFSLSEISEKLAHATEEERQRCEISPSGYGIHWPLLDEDLSIDGLLGIRHKPARRKREALAHKA